MTQEQWEQGIDAIMWLGYGENSTFPQINPASWEAAAAFHKRLKANLPPKPKPKLAVIRSYNAWSLSHQRLDQIRNPDDWLLQQWLEVWAVRFPKAYDVFELPPDPTPGYINELKITLRNYDYVISNIPFENTWYVGKNNNRKEIKRSEADSFQDMFAIEIKEKGWLTKSF